MAQPPSPAPWRPRPPPPPPPPPPPTCDGGRSWDDTKKSCECPDGLIWYDRSLPGWDSDLKECFRCDTYEGHITCTEREAQKKAQLIPILVGSVVGGVVLLFVTGNAISYRREIYQSAASVYRRIFRPSPVQIVPLNAMVPPGAAV